MSLMAFDYSSSPSSAEWASQLDGIFARCVGAYAEITLRGYRRDLEIFAAWCSETHVQFLASFAGDGGRFHRRPGTQNMPTLRSSGVRRLYALCI